MQGGKQSSALNHPINDSCRGLVSQLHLMGSIADVTTHKYRRSEVHGGEGTMKGSLLIGTSLLLLNVCAEAVAQNADYPLQALREGREGTSHFSVTVGTDGRAKDCVITKSSGSADLDAETCRMMSVRGRWSPAINANGAPVDSKYSGKVNWKIPR